MKAVGPEGYIVECGKVLSAHVKNRSCDLRTAPAISFKRVQSLNTLTTRETEKESPNLLESNLFPGALSANAEEELFQSQDEDWPPLNDADVTAILANEELDLDFENINKVLVFNCHYFYRCLN